MVRVSVAMLACVAANPTAGAAGAVAVFMIGKTTAPGPLTTPSAAAATGMVVMTVTVPGAETAPLSSRMVYWNVSVPPQPALGTYVTAPVAALIPVIWPCGGAG